MRLLLDTHILLAYIERRTQFFTAGTRRLLEDPTGEFLVSVASLWEIAIKHRLGKLQLAPSLQMLPDLIDAMNMELLPITARHVLAAVEPEPLTRDPFDRLLLAQCQIEDLRLITLDRAIVSHPLAAK
jgi:PIN domain nuclease of toxin-antitoxin system